MNSHKASIKQRGFTVVEIVIVIAVIVILASITLVAYSGTQNQAKAEKTRTNAATVKKVAETYYNTNNAYPTAYPHFRSTYVTMSLDVAIVTSGTISASTGENAILYRYVNSGTGACIMRWDYFPETGSPGIVVDYRLGTATSGNCNATTGTLPSPS